VVYKYEDMKKELFTDEGQRRFLKVRDGVNGLLKKTGAFQLGFAIQFDCASWFTIACIDRMVEIGELREVGDESFTQHKVFVKKG
jgi:hypothetical protein